MSYTEIYKFGPDGDATLAGEIKNSFLGAMSIWRILENKYLPKFTPSWAFDINKEYSRTTDLLGGGLKEIWDLFEKGTTSRVDKIVIGSTFDWVIVFKENIAELLEAFRAFEGDSSLKEQAELIEKIILEHPDTVAIAWNQTSVNGDVWISEETGIDADGDEYYLPYNIHNGDKHWNLFDDIKQ